MSTKTSIKRIALVAVSALGFGLLSIAPSSATQSDSLTAATTTSAVNTDAAATVTFTLTAIASGAADTMTVTPVLMSGPATNTKWGKDITYTVATGTTDVNMASVTADAATGVLTYTPTAAGRMTAVRTASFTPNVAGTYVFKFTAGLGVNNESFTWTITVTNPAVLASKAFISATTNAAPAVDDASTLLTASATTATAAKARIAVNQYGDAAGTTLIANTYASAVTVAISGAGSVGLAGPAGSVDSNPSRGPSVTAAAGAQTNDFYVFADGRTGTATITITVGTTVITKSFVFFGTGSGVKQNVTVAPKALVGIGETDTLTFQVTDSLGNLTGNNTALDFATSSNTAVATVAAVDGVVTVTGVGVGTATITVCNTAACASATTSGSTSVTVASTTVSKVTMAFDKDTYQAGEKMTLTVQAFDAAGGPIADGARQLFTTDPVSNVTGITAPSDNGAAGVTLKNGSATYTYYAPLASGKVAFGGTDSTTAAAAVEASATIANPSQNAADAATDAAAEAIDAANAATDAANLAAEAADAATVAAEEARDAADAATAAVEELATQVATLMAALKAQITTLANTVAKIAKKVKA